MDSNHILSQATKFITVCLLLIISACNSTPSPTAHSDLRYLKPESGQTFTSDFSIQYSFDEIEVYEGDDDIFIAFFISRYGSAAPFLFAISEGKRIELKTKYPKEQKQELSQYISNPRSLGYLVKNKYSTKQKQFLHTFSHRHSREVYITNTGETRGHTEKIVIESVDHSETIALLRKAIEKNDPTILNTTPGITYGGVLTKFLASKIDASLRKIESLAELQKAKRIFERFEPLPGALQCRLIQLETQITLQQTFQNATTVKALNTIKSELNTPINKCYAVKRDTVYKSFDYDRHLKQDFARDTAEMLPKGEIIKAEYDNVEILRGKGTEKNWVATEGNNKLGQKIRYSKYRFANEFQLVDPRDLAPLKPQWSTTQRKALLAQLDKFTIRDFKLADKRNYDSAVNDNSVESFKTYLANNPKGEYRELATQGLILAYRSQNTPNTLIAAYELTNRDNDFKTAFQLATNDKQKAWVLSKYALKNMQQLPLFFTYLHTCLTCEKDKYYQLVQNIDGFGKGLTADNIAQRDEYTYVLQHIKPTFSAIQNNQKYGFKANYGRYTLTVLQPGSCEHSHLKSERGWQGFLFPRTVQHDYDIYNCQTSPASNQKLIARAQALGKLPSNLLEQSWEYAKYLRTTRIDDSSSSQRSNLSALSADIKNMCLGASGKSHWNSCYGIKDANLKNVCLGMTEYPDSCYGVNDADLKNFCLGASGQYKDFCYNIKNKDLKEACVGISRNTDNCYSVKDGNLKSMCLGVSNSRNNCYNIR